MIQQVNNKSNISQQAAFRTQLTYFLKAVKSTNSGIKENAEINLTHISRQLINHLNQKLPLNGTPESDTLIQIAKESPKQVVTELINGLQYSRHENIRGNCACILGHIGENALSAQMALEHALSDSTYVKQCAAYGLRGIIEATKEKEDINPIVISGLTNLLKDPTVRLIAACALGHAGSKASNATPALTALLNSKSAHLPPAASFALRGIGKYEPAKVSRAIYSAGNNFSLEGQKWANRTIQAVRDLQKAK